MALFSSGENWPFSRPTFESSEKSAKAMMQAVTVTPKLQPVLSTTYRLERHISMPINIPEITARTVSWRAPRL